MKARKSKLDSFAARLAEWEASGLTLAAMQAELAALGCSVSASRLSIFLESQRSAQLKERLFVTVASGARMNTELDRAFAKNPAPEIAQLIRVVKTLVLSLQLRGQAEPELLELSNSLLKTVLDAGKLEAHQNEIALSREKFQFNATAAAMAKLPQLKTIAANSTLTEDQKLEQARLALFGVAPN